MTSKAIRRELWERDGGVCGICGELADPGRFHLDHIVPDARGGQLHPDNLRVAHPRCNQSRGLGEYRDSSRASVSTQIRIPEPLHERLSTMAERQYRSMNSLLVYLLADAVEREERYERERVVVEEDDR